MGRWLPPAGWSVAGRRWAACALSTERRSVNPMVVGEKTTPRVHAPPAELAELEQALGRLSAAHPAATFERYLHKLPSVASDVLIHAGSAVVGDVTIGEGSSVWYNVVLRGDMNRIVIGRFSNIQVWDLGDDMINICRGSRSLECNHVHSGHMLPSLPYVLCAQATVLDGAVIGRGSIVGAGAIVSAGMIIPPLSLVRGHTI
eukprot:scaffold315080_cov31-Tisochrysis_lutea.AAC.1